MALVAILVCSACLVPEPYETGKQGEAPASQALIKPVIPDDAPKGSEAPPEPQAKPAEPLQASKDPIPPPSTSTDKSPQGKEASPQTKPTKASQVPAKENKGQSWEDQKVKDAAMRLAKGFPATKKIKICYATKDDEWWVILYEDTGSYYELRQFVWDRDREQLQPFLVLKRIDQDQLNEHVAAAEPDRACEALDPPPRTAGEDKSSPDF